MTKLIYGTQVNDQLQGTNNNDILHGSAGSDVLLGLAGYDIVDYSRHGKAVTMLPAGLMSKGGVDKDQLVGIEEVIGAIGHANTINATGVNGGVSMNINLAKNALEVKNIPRYGDQRFTVKNFVNVLGSEGADTIIGGIGNHRFQGNGGNDYLDGGKGNDYLDGGADNDRFRGSVGRDTIIGGEGYDTVDYSKLGKAVTMLPAGLMSKGGVGKDQLVRVEEVIGAIGHANTINATGVNGGVSMNVNLAKNKATVNNIPYVGNQSFLVKHFVNVLGSESADKIAGNVNNNHLQGNGGDDWLNGVAGHDTLLGGAGADTFVLADSHSGFYHQNSDDHALISDLSIHEDVVQLSIHVEYRLSHSNGNSYLGQFTNGHWDNVAV
ncbi:MAG: hypothetical protein HC930_08315, partial [Hydrococcus sp. SU_1_0]|nr:hypothetical protein [Hydrococcus sp. SU_1_0]